MTRHDDVLRQVIDELANMLQGAVGVVNRLHQQAQMISGDAITLDNAIARAMNTIQRLHPPTGKGGAR
jgi:prophage DNA circulation protein